MCTVTFIARRKGYCLGMNRDEKLTRLVGLPPTRRKIDGRTILCPSEPTGGTWIALNDSGASLALINWYSVREKIEHNATSRGEIINAVAAADSPEIVSIKLRELPIKRINPFRLIGIFPHSRDVVEWRWNLKRLTRKKTSWRTQQWISSGFDEPTAQRVRGLEFRKARQRNPTLGLRWLRELHSSHGPHAGPFSTCMHRPDAATVSYTEITVSSQTAAMRYHVGSPCTGSTNCREYFSGLLWSSIRSRFRCLPLI